MNPRILIVDDDEAVLAAFSRTYRREYRVSTAPSAEDGIAILQSDGPFMAMVVDLHMPGMDGLAFLRWARDAYPAIHRIMLTGSDDLEVGAEAIESGLVAEYLCKPCPEHALREALARADDEGDGHA